MIVITKRVETLDEMMELMPLFMEGYDAMNKKRKVFEVDEEGFKKTLLGVLNTQPENGILVLWVDGVPVGYGVGFNDTPAFAKHRELLLWALYVRPTYRGDMVEKLFADAKLEAKAQGYKVLKAFNSRFTGGMYRLFETKLGMKRHRVQFNLHI